jgi:hypothetical protein
MSATGEGRAPNSVPQGTLFRCAVLAIRTSMFGRSVSSAKSCSKSSMACGPI